jgi:hypothetical protein
MQPINYFPTNERFSSDLAARTARLERDHATLNELMGGTKKMVFAIMAADEET